MGRPRKNVQNDNQVQVETDVQENLNPMAETLEHSKPTPSIQSEKTTEDKYKGLNERQKIDLIIKNNTYQDKETGTKIFVDEEKVYQELSLTGKALEDFIVNRDPHIYFNKGLCHSNLIKVYGDLLPEDREEVLFVRKVLKNKDILVYKHRRFNQYTLLIPKIYSEMELDVNNEFSNKYVHQDVRVIAFTGQNGVPSAYEEFYFEKQLELIKLHLEKSAKSRGVTL